MKVAGLGSQKQLRNNNQNNFLLIKKTRGQRGRKKRSCIKENYRIVFCEKNVLIFIGFPDKQIKFCGTNFCNLANFILF